MHRAGVGDDLHLAAAARMSAAISRQHSEPMARKPLSGARQYASSWATPLRASRSYGPGPYLHASAVLGPYYRWSVIHGCYTVIASRPSAAWRSRGLARRDVLDRRVAARLAMTTMPLRASVRFWVLAFGHEHARTAEACRKAPGGVVNSGTLFIRPVEITDRDAWMPPWKGYQVFYKVVIADEVSRCTWARLLDPTEPMHAALALDQAGRAVGMAHWILHRSTWTIGDSCYLQDLFVASEARNRGVGRHLIEHVLSKARTAGCSRVYWLTHETNRDAMVLYDRVADRSGFLQYRKALT